MEKRVKMGVSPAGVCCLVFSLLGGIYLLIGILCQCFPEDADDKSVGIIFTVLGIAFLIAGLILLLVLLLKRKQLQKLVAAGNYVCGEIADIIPNPYVHYNHRPTYTVLTRYLDESGTVHIFRSATIKTYPDRSILGRQVKIYCQDGRFQPYYVDIELDSPRVIEH